MLSFVRAAAALAAAAIVSGAAAQAPLPRNIKIVVPFSAGGSNDVIARAIAVPLGARLGIPVVVENKAGAAGVIGSDSVAKSPRDGSVLLLTSSSFLTAAATQKELPYDPLTAFVPVAMVGRGPMILVVSATTPYKTPADVVSAARAKPGVLNYGTAGIGSIGSTTSALTATGTRLTGIICSAITWAPSAVTISSGMRSAMSFGPHARTRMNPVTGNEIFGCVSLGSGVFESHRLRLRRLPLPRFATFRGRSSL